MPTLEEAPDGRGRNGMGIIDGDNDDEQSRRLRSAKKADYRLVPKKLDSSIGLGSINSFKRIATVLRTCHRCYVGLVVERAYRALVPSTNELYDTGSRCGDLRRFSEECLYQDASSSGHTVQCDDFRSGITAKSSPREAMKQSYRRLLFVDYDATLTKHSTLTFIASIASYPKIHPKLDELSRQYIADLEKHNQDFLLPPARRTDHEAEYQYLRSLESVESQSLSRIGEAQIFKDITASDIKRAAHDTVSRGDVELRAGWHDLIVGPGVAECHVVSVAWSATFIQETIAKSRASFDNRKVTVHANEIKSTGEVIGSPLDDDRRILTAQDKLDIMQRSIKAYEMRHNSGAAPSSIYVGDSTTDLMCLMAADVGVCIQDDPLSSDQAQLRATLERLRVPILPVQDHRFAGHDKADRVLWSARDLEEIVRARLFDTGRI